MKSLRSFLVLTIVVAVAGWLEAAPAFVNRPIRALYLGDSLSDFDRGSNHVDRLQAKLDELSPRCASIYNYAVRGDYIERMMERFRGGTNCTSRTAYHGIWGRQYDWAFVFLGHNDTRAWSETDFSRPEMSEEQLRSGFRELIALLKSKGIGRIILVSATSSNFEFTSRKAAMLQAAMVAGKTSKRRVVRYGDPKFLEAYNSLLADFAKQPGVEYLDIYTAMKALPDKASLVRPTDGVHLTEKGHAYVAEREYEYLVRVARLHQTTKEQ